MTNETILLTIERDDDVVARKQPVADVNAALAIVRREFQTPCGEFWVTIKNDAAYNDQWQLQGDTGTDTLTLVLGANSPAALEAVTGQVQAGTIISGLPAMPHSNGIVLRRAETK